MPPLAVLPVHECRVLSNPVVPDDDGALLPVDACLEVGTIGKMVVQELEKSIRFLLLETDNLTSDCRSVTCRLASVWNMFSTSARR